MDFRPSYLASKAPREHVAHRPTHARCIHTQADFGALSKRPHRLEVSDLAGDLVSDALVASSQRRPHKRAELRKIREVVELVSISKEVPDSVTALTGHLILRTEKGETETVTLQDETAYRVLLEKFKQAIRRDLGIASAAMQEPGEDGENEGA